MDKTFVAHVGLTAFGLAWVPQSIETVRAGRCGANLGFLLLVALGGVCLMIYAALNGDRVFGAINLMTTVDGVLNACYRLFPRLKPRADANPLRASAPTDAAPAASEKNGADNTFACWQ
jgi:lipid-A-disaccharide synthase-like uncharacterized protein